MNLFLLLVSCPDSIILMITPKFGSSLCSFVQFILDNLPVSLPNSVGITFVLQDTDSIRLDLVTAPVKIALIMSHPLFLRVRMNPHK